MILSETIQRALTLWGLQGANWQLIAERENQVFRVDRDGQSFALRLHRPGYRSDLELRSELEWMRALGAGGLSVPTPVASTNGQSLHVIDGVQVDLLTWLSGKPAGQSGDPLKLSDRTGFFHKLGREMARMHILADAWTLPKDFARCAWDCDGLVGEAPVWGRFWENPTLSASDRSLFSTMRKAAGQELQKRAPLLDYGLIHADLVRENVMVDGDRLHLIDFDDSGFGFRLFDIATVLLKNIDEPDYLALQKALIQGYRTLRAIDISALDLFMLLRSATYVGWITPRMNEPGSDIRNSRFVARTRDLALAYLESRP